MNLVNPTIRIEQTLRHGSFPSMNWQPLQFHIDEVQQESAIIQNGAQRGNSVVALAPLVSLIHTVIFSLS
jgi:hypothetical protein